MLRLVTSANTRDSVHPTDQLGTSCNRRALAATDEEDFGISAPVLARGALQLMSGSAGRVATAS